MATHETKDQLAMFAAVTDWNAQIGQIESIPDHFVEAFVRFKERRPRPIELEVPTDLLGQQADVEVLQPRQPDVPQGDPVQVERAWNLLRNAKRPVIFLGEEIHTTGGAEEIVRLAERLGAPVVTGDGAKGTFPENHPLSLGMALGNRIWGQNPVLDWMGDCDVALVLGSNLPYRSTSGIGLKLPPTVIHVLLDGDYIGRNYETQVPIAANSGAVVRQFLSAAGDADISVGDSYGREVAELKQRITTACKSNGVRNCAPGVDPVRHTRRHHLFPGRHRTRQSCGAMPANEPSPQLHVPPRMGWPWFRVSRGYGR